MDPTTENTLKLPTKKYLRKTKIYIAFPEKQEHTYKVYALGQIPINTIEYYWFISISLILIYYQYYQYIINIIVLLT